MYLIKRTKYNALRFRFNALRIWPSLRFSSLYLFLSYLWSAVSGCANDSGESYACSETTNHNKTTCGGDPARQGKCHKSRGENHKGQTGKTTKKYVLTNTTLSITDTDWRRSRKLLFWQPSAMGDFDFF